MKRRELVKLMFLVLVVMCARRHGEDVNIPVGYKGWVEIRYSRSCKPAPETRDGRRVLNIGADGRLCVGSKWEEGYSVDQFYYVDRTHRYVLREETPGVGMIWGRRTKQYNLRPEVVDRFFVGTEAEYRRATLGDGSKSHHTANRPRARRAAGRPPSRSTTCARYYMAGAARFLSVAPVLDVKRALREPQWWNHHRTG